MKKENKDQDVNKIIHIAMIANNLEMNGISSVIMNYCSKLDLDKFAITIFAGEDVSDLHREKCDELGIGIVKLPHRKTHTLYFYIELFKNMKKKEIDIVHVHGSNAAIAMELFIAKICGIHIRIAHSHNTTCVNMRAHKIMKPIFDLLYTESFACGKLAGKWLFGEDKEVYVMRNGFNTKKFEFNEQIRNQKRYEMGLQDKFVIGHIGRFNAQKNHFFLLKIFEEICKQKENAILLLVGTGPDKDKVKQEISKHPNKDKIIVYGESTTPENMYQVMDVFVFPSLFEGLPVTMLEAQISGLPCIMSDVITDEVALSNQVIIRSLNDSSKEWATDILRIQNVDRSLFFSQNSTNIEKYEINNCVVELQEKYNSLVCFKYGR